MRSNIATGRILRFFTGIASFLKIKKPRRSGAYTLGVLDCFFVNYKFGEFSIRLLVQKFRIFSVVLNLTLRRYFGFPFIRG